MARQNSALEFNNFTGGLVTEASPLTFPENASLDELNFNLFRDGTRRRRLGLDLEDSYQTHDTGIGLSSDGELYVTAHKWSDAALNGANNIAVVQVGLKLYFFDMSVIPLSAGLIGTHTFLLGVPAKLQYASVDGILVVVGAGPNILSFSYDSVAGTITEQEHRLKVRDFFGLEDIDPDTGRDLRDANNNGYRPETLTDAHLYNLRNQSWSPPRRHENLEAIGDVVQSFYSDDIEVLVDYSGEDPIPTIIRYLRYPSNNDAVAGALFADPNDSNDRVGDRFWPAHVRSNPDSLGEAPKGYFIIDLFDRSLSRVEALADLNDKYETEETGEIFLRVNAIPTDQTPNGPTCVESYAGRVFYAGFDSAVVGGDVYSPKLSSYVAFSQVIESSEGLGRCYQLADPTSPYDSEIVATDGGLVRIDGAENIVKMVVVGRVLVIFATNGVWTLSGGTDFGFSATNYEVRKISDSGTESPDSVVAVENSVLYWCTNGIYALVINEVGELTAQNLTAQTIQKYYQDISYRDRVMCAGIFDSFDRKVRWLYGNRAGSANKPRELVFDLDLRTFFPIEVAREGGSELYPAFPIETPPYTVGEVVEDVTVDGVLVTAAAQDVTVTVKESRDSLREVSYVTVTATEPEATFTFSLYRDDNFEDWASLGEGVDAPAHLLTGYIPGQDFQRYKQIPYVTSHMARTEDSFTTDEGVIVPENQSSCLMSARWDWSNSATSGKWSKPQQLYRYRRHYIPENVNSPYDYGFETIVTKSKLRGKGRVVSLKFETEPGKDCQLLGWSSIVGVNGNV